MSLLPNHLTASLFGAASVRSTKRFARNGRGAGPQKSSNVKTPYSVAFALVLWIATPLLLWASLLLFVWRLF